MRGLLFNYYKMLRSGFFYKSILLPLLLILPSLGKAAGFGNGFIEGFFIILIGYIIMSVVIGEISEKRYKLYTTLPLSSRDIIKIGYIHAYIIYGLSSIAIIVFGILCRDNLVLWNLIFTVSFILSFNIFFPYFASQQLKLGTNQQDKMAVWYIVHMAIMSIAAVIFLILNNSLQEKVLIYIQLMLITFLILTTFVSYKSSYNITIKKVKG